MNDALFEATRARLLALSEKWVGPLGLGWWEVNFAYARGDYDPPRPGHAPDTFSAAYCAADWRYGHATITFNMSYLAGVSDEKLERIFVHECMHILLNEMKWARSGEDADHLDHEERVASTLTKAMIWLRESFVKDVKAGEHEEAEAAVRAAP